MATEVRIKDNHIEEYDEYGNCIRNYGYSLGDITQVLVSGKKVAVLTGEPIGYQRINMHCDGNFVNQCDIYFSSDVESFHLSGDGNIIIVKFTNGQTYEYSTENGTHLRSY